RHRRAPASADLPGHGERAGTAVDGGSEIAMGLVLDARGITKQYGHVQALTNADFDVHAGEVVALIGDNGAGKSTLVRILSGAEPADAGEILFEDRPVHLTSPNDARSLGMETVFQDLALAPHLSPVQNMYLGREVMRKGVLGRLGFMDTKAMRAGSR